MNSTIIKNKSQLIEYFREGNTAFDQWGIGTEHEKFLFRNDDFKRLPYEGNPGIKQILEGIQKNGWEPIMEAGNIIGLHKDGASITLEPGGQFELSGKNFSTMHETYCETKRHCEELYPLAKELGFFSLPLGADPLWEVKDISWMPKERYKIMREYMPTVGSHGLEMMTRTSTIQVNLDYESEQDMVQKMRIAQAFQPIVTAIFANSPFSKGAPNGYLSYRSRVWEDTDPDRCGFLPFVFNKDFGFETWVDYLLDVPMYFFNRDGKYIAGKGMTFRQFMNGATQYQATIDDFETHCSTVFPDVRLKRYIEMRGADASKAEQIAALSAIWVGLLYDEQSRNEANELIKSWSLEDLKEIRSKVPKEALKAKAGSLDVQKIAEKIYQLADDGLTRRAKLCGTKDESEYLQPIKDVVESRTTQAEHILSLYHNEYKGDFNALMKYWQEAIV